MLLKNSYVIFLKQFRDKADLFFLIHLGSIVQVYLTKRLPGVRFIEFPKASHQLHFSISSSSDQLHLFKVVELDLQLAQLAHRLFVCGRDTSPWQRAGSKFNRFGVERMEER